MLTSAAVAARPRTFQVASSASKIRPAGDRRCEVRRKLHARRREAWKLCQGTIPCADRAAAAAVRGFAVERSGSKRRHAVHVATRAGIPGGLLARARMMPLAEQRDQGRRIQQEGAGDGKRSEPAGRPPAYSSETHTIR